MEKIKRYDLHDFYGMRRPRYGDYVFYDDHEKIVKEKDARIKELEQELEEGTLLVLQSTEALIKAKDHISMLKTLADVQKLYIRVLREDLNSKESA